MRVIFTGSRAWDNEKLVLVALLSCEQTAIRHRETLTVVHGGYRGLDEMVDRLGRTIPGVQVESHEADFATLGRRAGGMRNKLMVDLGADLCIGFPTPCVKENCTRPRPHDSHGTTNCLTLARAAGIPTDVYRLPSTTCRICGEPFEDTPDIDHDHPEYAVQRELWDRR